MSLKNDYIEYLHHKFTKKPNKLHHKIKKNSTTKKFRNNKRLDPKISRLRNDEQG